MIATPTKTRYEVNLYVEMFYPDFPSWKERLAEGLPDYNLIFLTELDADATIDQILKDAASRIPAVKDFLNDNDEFISEIDIEEFCSESLGLHKPSWNDLVEFENTCGQKYN